MVIEASAFSRPLEIPRRFARRVRRIGRRLRPGPVILMYHRVADESFDPWGLAVSPTRFAEQMDWLAAHRTVLPLATFAELHGQQALPSKAVALTFDDGYHCNAAVAAPIMKARNLPATVFICPTLIGRGEECWWDDLERIVLSAPGEELTLRDGKSEQLVHLGAASAGDRSWVADQPPTTARQRAFLALWSRLQVMEPELQHATIADLRRQASLSAEPRASHRLMTAETVAGAGDAGLTIGAHTLTHVALSHWESELQTAEIAGSRRQSEDLAGAKPAAFAYPYGDLNDESEKIVREAGFTCACTTESARIRPEDSLFRLPRVRAGNWTGRELAHALRWA